jgi:phage gp16-like protein
MAERPDDTLALMEVSMRTKQIRLIKCLCRDLGLADDEETRRLFYDRITGKRGLADMSEKELARVITTLKRQPRLYVGRTFRGEPMNQEPMAKKSRSLWLELRDLGVLRDSSEAALNNFALRSIGRRLDDPLADLGKLIEKLKKWRDRMEDTPKAMNA